MNTERKALEMFHLFERYSRFQSAACCTDGTKADSLILLTLLGYEEAKIDATVSDLGLQLKMKVPAVSRCLKRMEEAGLILRLVNTSDRRITFVSLTDQGRAESKINRAQIGDFWREVLSEISDEEIDTYVRISSHLFSVMETTAKRKEKEDAKHS